MKKFYLLLLTIILYSASFSQDVNYYGFVASSGASLDPMTGATTIVAANSNNASSALLPITFTFAYEGRNYTEFSASPHGLMKLGGIVAATTFSNNIYGGTNQLFPFWDGFNTGPTGSVSYVLTGNSPNRILKIQWFLPIPYSSSTNANSTMQAWLYEGTNVIEFRYGAGVGPTSSASIGINGSTSSNFISVTTPANTASTQTTNDNNTAWPGTGTMYRFTPAVASACSRPAAQPTSLTAPDKFPTAIGGYFNAASNNPTGYLIVRSVGAFTGTPVDGAEYGPDSTIGNGTVVQTGNTLSYTATGLTGNTQYTITVFSYNSGLCSGGPLYNTTSPPTVSARTCTAAPLPASSALAPTSASIKWPSSKGGGALTVTYTVDVATNNSFSSPIAGSPFTVNEPDTTLNISGLTENTTYYYRVNATGTCTATSTFSFTTLCVATSSPYVENFDAATTPNLPVCTRLEDLNGSTTWTTAASPKGFTGNVLQYTYNSNQVADDWFYIRGVNLTAGTNYTIGYKFGNDSAAYKDFLPESMELKYGTSPSSASMTTLLKSHRNFTYPVPKVDSAMFTPAASGTYYFGFHAYSSIPVIGQSHYLYLDSIVLKQTGTALPVSLSAFNAKRNGSVNEITWLTVQENNTSIYVIERSSDGQNFHKIGEVTAAGNSTNSLTYNFTDVSPASGTNYYRLKIIDKDDNTKRSDVRTVKNSSNAEISIYPNPVADVMKVDVNVIKADKGVITISDINGRKLYSKTINVTTGNNQLSINISNFEKGTYIIKVQLSDEAMVNKITRM